jgi:hypothetical protein
MIPSAERDKLPPHALFVAALGFPELDSPNASTKMGSSTNYEDDYQPEHPQTDGTPDGLELAEAEGGEGGGPEEVAFAFRLASVNLPVWEKANVGDPVTVDGQTVRVTGGRLGQLGPSDAREAESRGLDSGHVEEITEVPEPGAIIVLTP